MHLNCRISLFLLFLLSLSTIGAAQTTTTCFSISSGIDDIEETVSGGNIDPNSSDLELIRNGANDQLVGLRFRNISIPPGSIITNAYIQFTTDEASTGPASLRIRGENSGNSAPFTTQNFNLSQRALTTANISWNPLPWQIFGESGVNQRTPDISAIVTEQITSAGYSTGSAISFIISGTGTRTAESFETSSAQAAKLCVSYTSCLQDSDGDGICDRNDPDIKNDIVINEINYRSVQNQENIEFIELYNNDVASVDIGGWTLSNGIEYTFPSPTNIAPGNYLVVAANTADYSGRWSGAVQGPFQRSLSNRKDEVLLVDTYCNKIDEVDYESWKEWPNVRYDNDGDNPISIQKINPNLPGQHAGSWAAATPTPRVQNHVSIYEATSTDVAVVKSVSRSPNKPKSGDLVKIKVDMSQSSFAQAGPINVKIQYQDMAAGSYVPKSSPMYNSWIQRGTNDLGNGPDSIALDGVYTGTIPAFVQTHRKLVRYRIKITQANGDVRYYPDEKHTESNYAYYVYDGHANVGPYDLSTLNPMQEISIITTSAMADTYIGTGDASTNGGIYPSPGKDFLGEGTLIYNGKVYDHMRFRPRGGNSRVGRVKPGLKFDMNPERSITTQKDCGDDYDVERSKIILSGGWVGDKASHGLAESLIYKLRDLTGGLKRAVDYTQFRVVDNTNESDDYWGMFLILEDYNGDYLKEHGLAEGNFWNTDRNSPTRPRVLDYEGDFPGAANLVTFAPKDRPALRIYNGGDNNIRAFKIDNRGNLPLLFGDRIANEFYGQNGINYIGKHSYREYYDSESGKYHGWWGDMDNAFNSLSDDDTWFDRPVIPVDTIQGSILDNRLLMDNYQTEYNNALISAYDLIFGYKDPACNCTQADYLVDSESKKIFDPSAPNGPSWAAVDRARWDDTVVPIPSDPAPSDENQNHNLGSIAAHINWYKTWFEFQGINLKRDLINSVTKPQTPQITLVGTSLNNLRLRHTQGYQPGLVGNLGFAALEWRVGEWSDPNNSFYDGDCGVKYEIDTHWQSGEITVAPIVGAAGQFTIPAEANLKEKRTYLIRVRHKNTSGEWSHWSQPAKVVPTPATNANASDLVINEIMYNPNESKHAEFVELHNKGNTTIDLTHYEFTDGFEYTFPDGASIPAGEYICIAQDSADFLKAYGYYPFGDFKGALNNSGELLKLRGPFRTIVDTVRFTDSIPWPESADDGFYSIALKDPTIDNNIGSNWGIQPNFVTPCAANEFSDFGDHPFSGIVINEIHYNPAPERDANGVIVTSGTKFEFIEIKNISANDIDISNAVFTDGITYTFDIGTVIPAGGFIVLAEDKSSFTARYGFAPYDKYDGKLSNSGELITLVSRDDVILDQVEYATGGQGDFPPFWDSQANGGDDDRSLALINGQYDNNTKLNWKVQCMPINATTPGRENDHGCITGTGVDYSGLIINEIHYNPAGGTPLEFIEIVNSDPINFINMLDVALTGNGALMYKFTDSLLFGASSYPNNYIVLAKDSTAYHNAYGVAPYGVYSGDLNNSSETLRLADLFNTTIDVVTYGSTGAWDPIPATGSHSLALINVTLDNSLAASWAAQNVNETPKTVNTFDNCDDTHVALNNAITTTDQSVNMHIITNERIGPNSVVDYNAGNYIEMRPDFEVPLGTTYHAFIAPCQ